MKFSIKNFCSVSKETRSSSNFKISEWGSVGTSGIVLDRHFKEDDSDL
jgi:hypothetical protein